MSLLIRKPKEKSFGFFCICFWRRTKKKPPYGCGGLININESFLYRRFRPVRAFQEDRLFLFTACAKKRYLKDTNLMQVKEECAYDCEKGGE